MLELDGSACANCLLLDEEAKAKCPNRHGKSLVVMAELGCSFGKSSLTSMYCTYKAMETKDIVIILHSGLWLSNDFEFLFHDRDKDDVFLKKLNQLQDRPRPGVYNMLF